MHGRKKKIFAEPKVVDVDALKAKLRRRRRGEEYDDDEEEELEEEEEEVVEGRRGVRDRPTRVSGKESMSGREKDREREKDKGRIRPGSRHLQYEQADNEDVFDNGKKTTLKTIMSKQFNREKMEVPSKPTTKLANTAVKSDEVPVPVKKTGRAYLRPKPVRARKTDENGNELPPSAPVVNKMDEKISLKEAQNMMFRNIAKERKEKNDKEQE